MPGSPFSPCGRRWPREARSDEGSPRNSVLNAFVCLMPPRFPATSVAMENDGRNQRAVFGWALPASFVVHLLIAALLIFGLPVSLASPEKEQAVAVQLVPPPKPVETAAAEPPPPPPLPPEPKAEKPPEPKSEKPPPPEPKAEQPPEPEPEAPSAAQNQAARRPPAAIKPVVEFGEKDEGPRQSTGRDSAEEGVAAPTPDADKQELAEEVAAAKAEAPSPMAEPTLPEPAPPAAAAPPEPAPKPAAAPTQKSAKLQEAKKLLSPAATGGLKATTAMANIPRPVRAGQLCLTELRAQLLNGSPPYFPDLLPSEFRNDGKTVDIPKTAFRAGGQWYDLGYRCAVDADALRVVSFAFRVGEAIPRSEWKRRGLPAQ